jgi:formate-dependent phosphoribosylglycinamide formyltransferase (GAR transformylase)
MNIVILSPGYPAEMAEFTRGLASVGAHVIGVGEHDPRALPYNARRSLSQYVQVRSLTDQDELYQQLARIAEKTPIDRLECLWEPFMLLAARLRERLDLPGMNVAQTEPFRDKEKMKQVLDRAGVRTPRHRQVDDEASIRRAAEQIGFPLVIKPLSGAGSADTHGVADAASLDRVVRLVRHVQSLSVEEYIVGEEYTFDTVCSGGELLYENIAWYRPKPMIGRAEEWISMQTVNLRDIDAPGLQAGRQLGRAVLDALGFRTGFTHMEWFLTPAGEAVFGEIGARPPGGRSVDLMNYTNDFDIYVGWAEAVTGSQFTQIATRRYNAAAIFKRAQGQGRIVRIDGLDDLRRRFGESLVLEDLLPLGASRRDWKQTLIADGYLVVRNPDLATTLEMADRVGTHLSLYAD